MTARGRTTVVVGVAAAFLAAACGSVAGEAEVAPTTVVVRGTDALAFEPASLSVAAGTVTVELRPEEGVGHTFVVEELGDREVVAAAAGETATGTVALEPGDYTFYCGVPGHRAAGMEGTLSVAG